MANTAVDLSIYTSLEDAQGLWGPYWIDSLTAVIVYIDSNVEPAFRYTDDGGQTWTKTLIESGPSVRQLVCWFDRETSDDGGNLIHVMYLDSQGSAGSEFCKYVSVDIQTSGPTLGTLRTIFSNLTVHSTSAFNRIALTKAVNGRIVAALTTQVNNETFKSDEIIPPYFAATAIAIDNDLYETPTEEDWALLFPADVDPGDVVAIFIDRSASEITIKMFDDSLGTWSETLLETGVTSLSDRPGYDGAVRHSDRHILLVAHLAESVSGDALRTYDLTVDNISTPTVTDKGDIFDAVTFEVGTGILINQQSGAVYVAWLTGTSNSSKDCVYVISTNGMASWGSEQVYSEGVADDNRRCQGGRTIGDDGGRWQPTWHNDDNLAIYVNLVNDVEIAAGTSGGTPMAVLQFGVVKVPGKALPY